MRRFPNTAMALLAFFLATAVAAQPPNYRPRTGNADIDATMMSMNTADSVDSSARVDEIVARFGAPRYLVVQLMARRGWTPADVYYACALAHEARRPCSDVARVYEHDRAQGWAPIAASFGITPGSARADLLARHFEKSAEPVPADVAPRQSAPEADPTLQSPPDASAPPEPSPIQAPANPQAKAVESSPPPVLSSSPGHR